MAHDATYKYVDRQVADRKCSPSWKAIYNEPSGTTCGPIDRLRVSAKRHSPTSSASIATYMGGVERGERNLTLKSVERIAERINCDPLTLLQSTGEDTSR
jgi:hypothetical protein